MKGIISGVIGFAAGGAIGSASVALFFKKKYKDTPTKEETERYINEEISNAIKEIKKKMASESEADEKVIKPEPKIKKEQTEKTEEPASNYVDYHNAFAEATRTAPAKPVAEPQPKTVRVTKSEICSEAEAFDLEDQDNDWIIKELTFYKGDHVLTKGEGDDESVVSLDRYGIDEQQLNVDRDMLYFKNDGKMVIYNVVLIPESYEDTH